jgi:hypothetical protein
LIAFRSYTRKRQVLLDGLLDGWSFPLLQLAQSVQNITAKSCRPGSFAITEFIVQGREPDRIGQASREELPQLVKPATEVWAWRRHRTSKLVISHVHIKQHAI